MIAELHNREKSFARSRHNNPILLATITTTQHLRPTDRRAKQIIREYELKFRKLDRVYASDIVGDGSNGVVGPFEAALQLFVGGQVVPLVVGAFGDVNKDLETMLRYQSSGLNN